MMSQSFATYPLLQCIVSAAQFTAGEVSFYDGYAELLAADATGSSTTPLHIDYLALEHFRVVRAQCVLRLTLPHATVRQWAELNGFASQLDALNESDAPDAAAPTSFKAAESPQQMQTNKASAASAPSAVLLLQLRREDMLSFLQNLAPVVAASRRTRSASRISMTEPLPLYTTTVDPAPDVLTETRVSSPCHRSSSIHSSNGSSCHSSCVSNARRSRQQAAPEDALQLLDKDEKTDVGDRGRKELPSISKQASAVAKGAKEGLHEKAQEKNVRELHNATPAVLGDEGSYNETGNLSPPQSDLAKHETEAPKAETGKTVADEPMRLQTLESVEEELAGLLSATEYPVMDDVLGGGTGGRRAQPLQRPISLLPTALSGAAVSNTDGRGRGRGSGRGRGCGRGGMDKAFPMTHSSKTEVGRAAASANAAAAAPSLCPSLQSSTRDSHADLVQATLHQKRALLSAGDEAKQVANTHASKRHESHANRPVIAHLCTSDKARSSSAERPSVEQGTLGGTLEEEEVVGETVATVTYQRRELALGEKAPCILNPCENSEAAEGIAPPPSKAFGGGEAVSSMRSTLRFATPLAHDAPVLMSMHRVKRTGSPATSASSVRLGDFLKHDEVQENRDSEHTPAKSSVLPLATEKFKAAKQAAKKAHNLIGTEKSERPCVHFESSVTGGAAVAARKPLQHPFTAELKRDVKSYLLDLFPPSKELVKRQRPTDKKATVPSSAAAPAAPRRRARQPKPKKSSTCGPRQTLENTVRGSALEQPIPSKILSDRLKRTRNEEKNASAAEKQNPDEPQRTSERKKRSRTDGDADDATAAVRLSFLEGSHAMEVAEEVPLKRRAMCAVPTSLAIPSAGAATEQEKLLGGRGAAASSVVQLDAAQSSPDLSSLKPTTKRDSRVYSALKAIEKGDIEGEEEGAAAGSNSADRNPLDAAAAHASQEPSRRKELQQQRSLSVTKASAEHCNAANGTSARHSPNANVASLELEAQKNRVLQDAATEAFDDGASTCTSQATCPLFYRRDSRKERMRRLLRYMNLISQHLAVLHETHDELRGLMLAMMNENQI